MVKIYNLCIKAIQATINLLYALQIILMILIFLSTAYWFFNLINSPIFDFAAPIIDWVYSIVKLFYNEEIVIGGVFVDGTILIFDICAIGLVYLIAKLKYYLHQLTRNILYQIRVYKDKLEERFNAELKVRAEIAIRKANNVAVLVKLDVTNKFANTCWGDDNKDLQLEKNREVFKIFYATIKTFEGCRFAKTENKMLILLDDFSKVDELLNYIDLSINRIRTNLKKKKWSLSSSVAVEAFPHKMNFKEEVYPILERLLDLQMHNEIVCLSTFCTRYELEPKQMYVPSLRGKYRFNEESNVWSLIKKI